ncbi:pre-mRNA-splicing factor SPF27 homolog [Selaginella moellendorffii]|uniref:pre-mRNA-splicing factor SPF27 homolog n=1 Tax=Selaginella moellendorffii TaxID=88036 RepID=UPI000D1CCDF0|nr:pre-mRNA-splicing factor SPF27 homolog [Selaginella moellendorffii]|eukprot:XP_024516903.1 pre-mRNA-splicing factor SPF27 homolog [Selaginella moellendorffii]
MMMSDGARWRSSDNTVVDALPYVDHEYADPQLKREVERLIDEEMSRSSKRPVDFLQDLPPLPSSNLLQEGPLVAKALERLRAGRPPLALDLSRYGVQAPPVGKRNDLYEWNDYLRKAKVQLEYQTMRIENLELLLQYSGNTWRAHNQRLEAYFSKLQSIARAFSQQIESLNRDRKLNQQAAATVLTHLRSQWVEICQKNIDIDAACTELEAEIESLHEQASQRGIDVTPFQL